jgi:hypothetical protein
VQDRLTELRDAGIVEPESGAWQLTDAGRALLAALDPLLVWERRYLGPNSLSRDDFLKRVSNKLRLLTGKQSRHEGVEVVCDLAEASISVSCVGGAKIEAQLVSESGHIKERLLVAKDDVPAPIDVPAQLQSSGTRWILGLAWFLDGADYGPFEVAVNASLEWLMELVKPSSGHAMTKSDFLRWVEDYMELIARQRGKGKVAAKGSHRHYRTVTVEKHRRLGIDALETGEGAPLLRVHLLSSDPSVTERWSRIDPPGPFPDGVKPGYRAGTRKGAQQYFGFSWPNNPIDYQRWLPRVEACADYLVLLARDEVL